MRNAGARGARPTPCLIARCAQVGYLSGDFDALARCRGPPLPSLSAQVFVYRDRDLRPENQSSESSVCFRSLSPAGHC
jgi:hypothetical protein